MICTFENLQNFISNKDSEILQEAWIALCVRRIKKRETSLKHFEQKKNNSKSPFIHSELAAEKIRQLSRHENQMDA